MDDNSLQHDGIIGQKKGVRRFRNYDGTLTPAGKERYNYSDKQIDSVSKTSRNLSSALKDASDMLKTKGSKEKLDLSKMSNYDLKKRIDRERLERDYNELFANYARPKVESGKKIASKILDTSAKAVALTGGALAIALSIKQLKNG